jgi:hypothetical protein
LYFSCKNYNELAQARITKVVEYFTTNPTKLALHLSDFSVIFYAIYKKQPKQFYYLSYQLQRGPRKDFQIRNVVPGRTGRRGSPELSHSGGGFGWGMGGEGRGGH